MISNFSIINVAPPFLTGVGLIIWGWQTEYYVYAIVMAVFIESANWVKYRLHITDKEFNRISDLSGVIFFIMVVYLFGTYGVHGIYEILKNLPFIFYPLFLCQKYSSTGSIRLSSLLVSTRQLSKKEPNHMDQAIDLSLPFFFLCLLSASSGNQYPYIFFTLISLLFIVLLWYCRPKRTFFSTWLLLICLSSLFAFLSQVSLQKIQKYAESIYLDFFSHMNWAQTDPYRETTSIGSIGRLKLSDKIIYRVKADNKLNTPLLLREASYNYYGYGVWTNIKVDKAIIDPEIDGSTWILNKPPLKSRNVEITTFHKEDEAVLALPQGANKITDLPAFQLQSNGHGAIQIEIKPGWHNYRVNYDDLIYDKHPNETDLHVNSTYQKDLHRLAEQLALYEKQPADAVSIIENYFHENFRYSLIQKQRFPRGKYLSNFLNNTKHGHCEYFATATVLLLRTIGIPARYAVGYSIHEYNPFEGQYLARSRHAHSWVLAYLNDGWQTIDTTPSVWADMENEHASALQLITDLWSWLRVKTYLLTNSFSSETNYYWLFLPVILIGIWRIYHYKKIKTKPSDVDGKISQLKSKNLSFPVYKLITQLENIGYTRQQCETLKEWGNRTRLLEKSKDLEYLFDLHYQQRYKPGEQADMKKSEELVRRIILDLGLDAN